LTCDCEIGSLRFWDNQHGALVLDGAYQDARGYAQNFLYTTIDGGRSWQLGRMLPANAFSVYFLDAAHGWTLDAKANNLLFSAMAACTGHRLERFHRIRMGLSWISSS
jgi:hypothetical protein